MTLLLILSVACQVPGSVAIDPALNWYTVETEHFSVHFSSRERPAPDNAAEELGRRIAALCEEAHALLVPMAGWSPRGRTDVVVADFFDYANGWAAPFPRNTITIIPTLPAGNRVPFDDWLRKLIIHEYAHILQLDMVRGVPGFLRRVFGRVVLTNPMMPYWLIEGWAIKAETDLTGRGRIGSTEYDMMLRAAADSNRLLPIDRTSHYSLETFPAGNAPYLYGGSFYRWAERAYNDTVWRQYHRQRSGGVPFFEEPHARKVFGRSFSALWRDWQKDVHRHADTTGRRLEQAGLTEISPLTEERWYPGMPRWSRTGRELYYSSRSGTEYPGIKAVEPGTGERRVLHRGIVSGAMSLSPDGRRLVFSEREVWRNYYEFSDLWILDLADGSLERLTRGLRATDPDWCSDSVRIVFILNRSNTTDLTVFNLRDSTVSNLTNTVEPTGYSRPRFSPDGRYIAVSVNRPDGSCNIEIHDTRSGWVIPVTEDRFVNLTPEWSPTGKWLYYSSDRSGVFNIHAWSPGRDRSYRCTNARWGVFEPAVSPDNRSFAVTAYTPGGFEIAVLPLDPESWVPDSFVVFPETATRPVSAEYGYDGGSAPLYHYSPLPSLMPALWLPLALPEEDGMTFGAMTFGWDALQRHRYNLMGGWQTGETPGPRLIADYRYHGIRPELTVETDLALDQQVVGVFARLPFRRTRTATSLSIGSRLIRDEEMSVRWFYGYSRSSARRYRFDVAPTEGCGINVSSSFEHRAVGGVRNRWTAFHDFRRWFGMPAHSSIRARLAFGIAGGDASADSAWQLIPGPAAAGVRGFTESSEHASRTLITGIEYRMPLLRIERGIGTTPFFLSNINTAGFAETGLLWNGLAPDPAELDSTRLGTGVELRADMILGHTVPGQFAFGVGFGRHLGGGPVTHQFYFRFESALLSGLLNRKDDLIPGQ